MKLLNKISYNAPVVLTYTFICFGVFIINELTRSGPSSGWLDNGFTLRGNYQSSFSFFSGSILYIFNHGSWGHLIGNMSLFLILGPILEEKYGSKYLVVMILSTTIITSIFHILLYSHSIIGASGIVFMFIILVSFTNVKEGNIPLTFILVFIMFVGKEIYNSTEPNEVSEFAHIFGGICGSLFGLSKVFGWNKEKPAQDHNSII